MAPEKVLVIRKTDKTIHKVPLANKATLMAFNNRLPENLKWTFEEMDPEDARQLPFIDKAYVTAEDAITRFRTLEAESTSKDAKIAELEAAVNAMKESR